MELTIEQRERLVKEICGHEPQRVERNWFGIYPPLWFLQELKPIKNSYAVVSDKSGKPSLYISKNQEDFVFVKFNPESNLEQAVMLLGKLCKVSNEHWKVNYAPTGEKRIYCQPKADLVYNEYGSDLCELIVRACLWWIENNEHKTSI